MKVLLKDNRAFTLLEMLLVLFIVSLVSSIVLNYTISFSQKRVVDQFFKQLQFDIQSVQALAIEEQRTTMFVFDSEKGYYAIFEYGGEPIFEREYPKEIQFNLLSTFTKFKFNQFGEIRSFGKLKFFTPFGEKQLIINMQKGRMRIEEL